MNIEKEVISALDRLGKKTPKLTDNIFDLGIDSLSLVQAIADFEDKFNVEIDDRELVELQTVQNIVDLITKKLS